MSRFARSLSIILLGWFAAGRLVSAAEVDFARDVLPILQRSCFECHGEKKAAGGLKLDSAPALAKGGDSGAVVIAKYSGDSELLRRISLPKTDGDVMPNRGEPLSAAEIAKIKSWIEAGAIWPEGAKPAPHWAYVAPQRVAVPFGGGNEIDSLIRPKLSAAGLQPSPPAEPAIIARRLYLDIIGLPPPPERVIAFEREAGWNLQVAVEKLVDELLSSKQYGEKWARPWLDAARYADSHGFQRDDLRDLWPYRDWVIRALNADMPFDQFTLEQLGGDLLSNATESQRIATGFNRCAPCNVEAGTDPEENRVNQVFDRVNTLGAVWLGTTLECAQCHDHKYDPISQRDYYGLFAYFNQTEIEAERANPKVPGSIKFIGPYLELRDPELDLARSAKVARLQELKEKLAAARATEKQTKSPGLPEDGAKPEEVLQPTDFDSVGDAGHKILEDGSVLLVGDPPVTDTYTVMFECSLDKITGLKLEALTDPSLPGTGPGRGDPKRTNFVLHEFSVEVAPKKMPDHFRPVKLTGAKASFSQEKWDVAGAVDGDAKTGWAISPRFQQPHWATFKLAETLIAKEGVILRIKLVQDFGQARTIGRLRISALTGVAEVQPKNEKLAELEAQVKTAEAVLAAQKPLRTLVMEQVSQSRPTHVLTRGDFRTPGQEIAPATPAVWTGPSRDSAKNRLTLARWLTDARNPLTARVAVNRLWLEIFGEGLVSTPEDFGLKGQPPTHPELLDWLAVEYRENGWSQKKLLKLILTSETYRQQSRITPELRERDSQNRLLSRGPSFRLSAEGIRDNALAISGLLDKKQFGPPIYPPQPDGLWNKVGGERYEYTVSPGTEQYRRGIYVVLKRMSPNPSMITFDATARLSCRVKRLRSNTPLQALTLLNDPVYVGAAKAFAERIQREQTGTDERLKHAFRLAVSRGPRESELLVLKELLAEETEANGDNAAWFAVASALLNLNETITKG